MGKEVLCSLAESPKPFQLWDPWEGVVWVSDVKVGSPGFSGFIMDPVRKEDNGWGSEGELREEAVGWGVSALPRKNPLAGRNPGGRREEPHGNFKRALYLTESHRLLPLSFGSGQR